MLAIYCIVGKGHGSPLLRGGTVVFDDLRRSVREIEFLTDPTAGEVRIAGSDVLNGNFVAAVIDRLARKFPRLFFHVLHAPRLDVLYPMVRERSVDFGMAQLAIPLEGEDLQVEALYPDTLLVVAGLDSKWVRRRKVEIAELIDEPWLLPTSGSFTASVIARAFHERGFAAPRHIVTDSIPLWQAMIATGRVIAFATQTRLRLSGKHPVCKAVPVDLRVPYGEVSIITLKDRTISPTAQLFIECAREMANSLAEPQLADTRRRKS
jgi:DNA-binding transcriptional LysR family regulator